MNTPRWFRTIWGWQAHGTPARARLREVNWLAQVYADDANWRVFRDDIVVAEGGVSVDRVRLEESPPEHAPRIAKRRAMAIMCALRAQEAEGS